MNRSQTIFLLGSYFFCYTIPQYIPSLFYVYDRIAAQLLFLTILNIIAFSLIIRKNTFQQFFSIYRSKYHFYSYLGFVLFSSFSLLVAENFTEGLVSLTKIMTFFLSFMIIVFLSQSQKINFLKIFITFSLIALFVESGLINYLFYESVITNGNFLQRGNAFKGLAANINIASFSIALKIPVLIYIIFSKQKKYLKLICFILIYSSFLTILLLLSRAAILAIVFISVSLFFMFLLNTNKLNNRNFLGVILSVFLSFVSYQLINDKNPSDLIVDRFSTITDPATDGSVKERINFYTTAFQSIKENPIFGVGVGNWKIISIKYSKDIIKEYVVPYFVHNDFLQVMAEIGLLGGLFYIFYIFYPFYRSFREVLIKKTFSLSFMMFLIIGVYIIDSMLNFPMDRSITYVYLIFSIALFYQLIFNKIYEK